MLFAQNYKSLFADYIVVIDLDKEVKYIQVRSFKSASFVHLTSLDEFVETYEAHSVSTVFFYQKKPRSGIASTRFLFYYDGLMYGLDGRGYFTLDDMKKGIAGGFGDSALKVSIEKGTAADLERGGGAGHSNDGEIFYHARKLGYKDYTEFSDALKKGFGNEESTHYHKAIDLGFDNASEFEKIEEYLASIKKEGFESIREYKKAHSLGLDNKSSYRDYLTLEEVKKKYNFETIQEAHLFLILNRKGLDREKKIKDLVSLLEKESPTNWVRSNGWCGRNTNWYTTRFGTTTDLENFLSSNKQVTGIGIYYPDKKTFVNFSDKVIVVDGSNIAWNNGDRNKGARPLALNIKLVIDELRKKGFNDIRTFYDASLPHDIQDKNVLTQLEKDYGIQPTPSRTDADHFLIDFAKALNAYLVTNDSLMDYALKDKWVMKYRDRIRIAAVVSNGLVSFSSNLQDIDLTTFKSAENFEFGGFETLQNKDSYDMHHFIIDPEDKQRQNWSY